MCLPARDRTCSRYTYICRKEFTLEISSTVLPGTKNKVYKYMETHRGHHFQKQVTALTVVTMETALLVVLTATKYDLLRN